MNEKVLITGASGFVGYHLITEALSQGYEVHAAIRESSKIDHLSKLPLRYVYLNYSSTDHLQSTLKDFDYIIHAAGITKAKNEQVYNKVNADASKTLAEAAVKGCVTMKKFVFVSSLAALGPLTDLDTLIHDASEPQPVTAYGRSKLRAERYLQSISRLPLLGFRPTAVYGPRERDLFILIQALSRGLDPYIGKFDQQLSFIYVKDLAKIIINSLHETPPKQFYNVSDGMVYDRYALADTAKQILQKKALRIHLPLDGVNMLASFMDRIYAKRSSTPVLNKEKMNELTAINWACDVDALKDDLGFAPQYDLQSGLAETIQWYKANHWI